MLSQRVTDCYALLFIALKLRVFPGLLLRIIKQGALNDLIWRSFKPILMVAGLPDIPFYSLRHTYLALREQWGATE
jgi:integrase